MRALFLSLIAVCLFGSALADTPVVKSVSRVPVEPIFSAPPGIPIPDREREYVGIIDKARKAFQSAKSVDGRRGARAALQIDAHNFMGLSHDAKDWVGIFKESNFLPDGKRSLRIEISPNVTIETWDNEFDDRAYETLIKPFMPIGKLIGDLSVGQPVSFSANLIGAVISSDEDMVLQPRVIAKFSDFKVLNEPQPTKK
jgi:hypothetical protein